MKIRLGRQRFWLDGWRFEIWPEIISKLPDDLQANTAKELAENYLDIEMDEKGRLGKNEELYGLFGGHKVKSNGSYKIDGIRYIHKGSLTKETIELKEAFLNKKSNRWMVLLAEQILKYSPRIRSIIIPMLESDLRFEKGWFVPFYNKTSIVFNGEEYYPFSSDKEDKNLNSLLKVLESKALGPWWKKEISLLIEDGIDWCGSLGENPSLSGLGHLKCPFELFRSLSWIDSKDNKNFFIDKSKFKQEINPDLYYDLAGKDVEMNKLEILKELVEKNKDPRGFIPVQEVGHELYKIMGIQKDKEKWIDKLYKSLIADNKIEILEHQSGQPRHGKGLYGKREYQLIKIEFLD
ncbi:MAG: hypothetical protein ACOCRO_05505 [Halanaerobiales bacterium]